MTTPAAGTTSHRQSPPPAVPAASAADGAAASGSRRLMLAMCRLGGGQARRRSQRESHQHQQQHWSRGRLRRRSGAEPALRVCGCLHVRTGTLLLAVWHLAMNLLTLSALITVLLRPQLVAQPGNTSVKSGAADAISPSSSAAGGEDAVGGGGGGGHLALDTATVLSPAASPSANSTGNHSATIVFESEDAPDRLHSDDVPPPKVMSKHSRGYSVFVGQIWHTDDVNVGILVTFCLFIITLLMLIGTVRGQPSYLMPFFCLQVFNFCISCLTLVSYLSLLPDARQMVAQWPHVPWRRHLLLLDSRWLALLVVVVFLAVMAVKAYLIGMVWTCYRYLLMRQTMEPPVAVASAASLVPPAYHDALHDARFAKIDLAHYPQPPPSYDAATAAAAVDSAGGRVAVASSSSCAAQSVNSAGGSARRGDV